MILQIFIENISPCFSLTRIQGVYKNLFLTKSLANVLRFNNKKAYIRYSIVDPYYFYR